MENLLTVKEVASFLQSYGIKCHWHDVQSWAVEGQIKAKHEDRAYRIAEKDAYEFLDSLWKGNSYEVYETMINRLIKYNEVYQDRITKLEEESQKLRLRLAEFEVKQY
ncbi:hypothetical protein [Pseudoneobacillus sp. C159]